MRDVATKHYTAVTRAYRPELASNLNPAQLGSGIMFKNRLEPVGEVTPDFM